MTDDQIWEMFSFLGHAVTLETLAHAKGMVLSCMFGQWELGSPQDHKPNPEILQ